MNLSFDPDGDFENLDTGESDETNGDFTYTADDAEASSAAADVEVTVNGVNDAPVCENGSVAVSEDGPADSTAPDCTDVDEETLTYTVTQPTKGVASENDVNLSFDPDGDFENLDTGESDETNGDFTYTANDGTVDSAAAAVAVTVTGVNDAPVCEDVAITTNENTADSTTPDCTDVDEETLTYTVTQPTKGIASEDDADLTFDPDGQYEGLDTGETDTTNGDFSYTANDSTVDSNTANVAVTVNGANDAPVCEDVAITTNENTADSTTPDCTDVDEETLTYTVTQPTKGIASEDDVNLSFDPDGDYEGLDTGEQDTTNGDFSYTANDSTVDSNTADVAVTVNGANDAPVCEDVAITTDENTSNSTTPDCTDVDEEPLTYTVTQPTKGIASENDVDLTFDPSGDFEGLDTGETDTTNGNFTYTANDSTVDSAAADVAVTVNGANDAPVCEDAAITVSEDGPADSTATDCTDVDEETLTYTITQPTKGVASENDVNLSFDPDGDYEGLDTGESDETNGDFTYTANDAEASSAAADVEVTVNGVNDAPVCAEVAIAVSEDGPADSTAPDCTDVDEETLTYTVTQPTKGIASEDDVNLSFDPDGDYEGLDTGEQDTTNGDFSYTANDSTVDSNTADVAVTVNGANDAPVCEDVAITTDENTSNSTTPDCTDVDEEPLTYTVTQPTKGIASENDVDLTFDPSGDFEGLDTGETDTTNGNFTYTANDSTVDSAAADVAVTVNGANDAPVCEDAAITVSEDGPADSTATDCTDVDEETLTYTITQPAKGIASENDVDLTFDPNGDFEGLGTGETDTTNGNFTYTANDTTVDSNTADVAVTVNGANDAPVVVLSGPASAAEGETKTFAFDTTDPDSSTFTLDASACGDSGGVVGSVDFDTATGDGSFDCLFDDDDPTGTAFDTSTVEVTVSDEEESGSDTHAVTVTNLDPVVVVASPMSGTYPVGASITVIATFTDAGTADSHTCTVNGVPGTVTYTGPGEGTCTGTASPSAAGPFTITVVVTDDDLGSDSAVSVVNVLYAIYAHEKCSGGSGKGLIVNGPDADIDGGIHSNGNFKVDGQNFQSGTASVYRPQSGCTTSYNPARVNFGPPSPTAPVNVPLQSWPWNPVKADFTCTYTKDEFLFNKAGQVIPSGVYCANKLFKINASNVSGIITVIAPEIALNGKNIDLFPHSKDVLLLGTGTKEIVLDGDLTPDTIGGFTGLVHNPGGGVKVNGKAISTYRSYIQALWVEINLAGFRMRY